MKIYSNVLGDGHIWNAAHNCGLNFHLWRYLRRPRIAERGWNLLLERPGSRRHFNTGKHGAGEAGAASRDDWGRFLAVLFRLDPELRAGPYHGEAHFHLATGGRYQADVVAGIVKVRVNAR